ncbi:MAG: hypothetical protein JSU07_06540 [Bacteroidetes bacterium]|nr:hypothetical protein [Bacteroidota bacterium]
MNTEEILSNLNLQISELYLKIEVFKLKGEQTNEEEYSDIQHQLSKLNESVTIAKFVKQALSKQSQTQSAEISVPTVAAESTLVEENKNAVIKPKEKTTFDSNEKKEEGVITLAENTYQSTITTAKIIDFKIGINDKFRFINELFTHNQSEYITSIECCSKAASLHDVTIILNELSVKHNWQANSPTVKHFINVIKSAFT